MKDSIKTENLVTKRILADRLGVSIRTIDNWMKMKLIPFYKMGRKVFFNPEEIEKHRWGYGRLVKVEPISKAA